MSEFAYGFNMVMWTLFIDLPIIVVGTTAAIVVRVLRIIHNNTMPNDPRGANNG
jgi:hypothetical protein